MKIGLIPWGVAAGRGRDRARCRSRKVVLVLALMAAVAGGCACEKPAGRMPRGVQPPLVPTPKMGPEVPVIRVKLGDDGPSFAVAVAGPWRLTTDAGEVSSGETLDWTEVKVQDRKVVFGSAAPVAGAIELRSQRDAGVWIRQAVRGAVRERGYRGALRVAPTSAGLLRAINSLPLEAYVAGVLANELVKSWHGEAYKAQAVAARTYGLIERNQKQRYDFDVYDSTVDQVYGGCGTETRKSWLAVRATWGVVGTYRGAAGGPVLVQMFYHSACGGETAPAGSVFGGRWPPPLDGGVACNYCRKAPKYTWPPVTLTKQEIGEALRRTGQPAVSRMGGIRSVEVAERAGGGRATEISVVDAAGQAAVLRASYWRTLMGPGRVPSTWFNIQDAPDRIVLMDGRGYGHGVGLCQWGTSYLADRGKTAEEILRYYYPGIELTKAY
jgi:stage II sporulation protein D